MKFTLEEYVAKIELSDSVKWHLEDTKKDFLKYLQALAKLPDDERFFIMNEDACKELSFSSLMENQKFVLDKKSESGLYFDSLDISKKRIIDLHNFVINHSNSSHKIIENDYRNIDVSVVGLKDGKETILYNAVAPKEVESYMEQFYEVYKNYNLANISDPFIKSSIMHLLFVRVHPFRDGNGRTARLIHNLKFTDCVNKHYGTNLNISPLNISENININKITYATDLDRIMFVLSDEENQGINIFLDHILNNYDERLYYIKNSGVRISEKSKKLVHILPR